ncbi:MAG: hypothetical protein ABMA13_22675, partial [Chthoniobacteraceae bacterium]
IILTVEDVLPRIPPDLLSEGPHDLGRELHFKVEDLSADIARGRGAVPLGRIAVQVPELFCEPIADDDQRQVRLPLQKLVEQIGLLPINKVSSSMQPEPAVVLQAPPEPGPFAPREQAPVIPSSARISLSLAAVLRTCPRELIVGELPPIPDEDRISFPWAPIEKQIPGGHVEVSSVRFIFALPAYLQGHLEAREGVRVPLPLDEIQRNLPAPEPESEQAGPVVLVEPAAAIVPPTEIVEAAPEIVEPVLEIVEPSAPVEPVAAPEIVSSDSPEPVAGTEPEPLHLPPPFVTHAPPPPIAATFPVIEPAPPAVEFGEAPAGSLVSLPPIFVPPQLRQNGGSLAPDAPEPESPPAVPEPEPPPLSPPNVWMQPPPEIATRPVVQWPPDVAPPPSPILPVRMMTPPVVRPFVAPPPLFGSGIEEPPIEIPTEPVAPPRPLNLDVACVALGLDAEATLTDVGAVLTRLPGVSACWIAVRHESGHGGDLPPGFDADAARGIAVQLAAVADAADNLGVGRVQNPTIFADDGCVSFFTRGEATVCAILRTRAFLPGVREKLAAAADALSLA